ncbi:hypothetical protein Tco_0590906 [Tanacetum coccineum]
MKTLSISGRLTLLKLVLGSMPIYHMSLFKVPMKVLQRMESIRCHFFNGVDHNGKKPIWWVWRFRTQGSSLWARVIKGIHGEDGKLGKNVNHSHPSIWLDIVREMEQLKNHGIALMTLGIGGLVFRGPQEEVSLLLSKAVDSVGCRRITTARRVFTVRRIKTRERIKMKIVYQDYLRDKLQDYEWYEAMKDSELKDEALRNKTIMEGLINEDDDELRYEQKRQWNMYTNYDDAYELNHGNNEKEELCEVHELPACNIRRYMMIKYCSIMMKSMLL